MPLDDPVREAAQRYLDSLLTTRFEPDAREAAFAFLDRRESPRYGGTDELLRGDTSREAERNAIQFLKEAERLARERGDDAVSAEVVQLAWIQFCPGFYPFC